MISSDQRIIDTIAEALRAPYRGHGPVGAALVKETTEEALAVVAALKARRIACVELPEGEPDDDGQIWFEDYQIRVDTTVRHGARVFYNKRQVTPGLLRSYASEFLAAADAAEESK